LDDVPSNTSASAAKPAHRFANGEAGFRSKRNGHRMTPMEGVPIKKAREPDGSGLNPTQREVEETGSIILQCTIIRWQ
jgi:hypothetical protein